MSRKKIRVNICRDIDTLIDLLNKQPDRGCEVVVEGLEKLRTKVRSVKENDTWKLNFDLSFKKINKRDLKIPKNISEKITDITLLLRVNITEKALSDIEIEDGIVQNNSISKPIKYGVQIIAYAKVKDKLLEVKQFKAAWHLDKHIRSDDGIDGVGSGFLHPEYHFNMGGFGITKDDNTEYGNILIIDTPRLMHPPLDSILAVDFIINNFYGCKAQNLLTLKGYRRIVANAKKRLWRPYFIALANQWESNFDSLSIEPTFSQKILGEI